MVNGSRGDIMRTPFLVLIALFTISVLAVLAGESAGQGLPGKSQTPPKKNKKGGRPGEVITPAAKGERKTETLRVGDPAPDFSLPVVKGDGEISLADFRGKKPAVLIFASYT